MDETGSCQKRSCTWLESECALLQSSFSGSAASGPPSPSGLLSLQCAWPVRVRHKVGPISFLRVRCRKLMVFGASLMEKPLRRPGLWSHGGPLRTTALLQSSGPSDTVSRLWTGGRGDLRTATPEKPWLELSQSSFSPGMSTGRFTDPNLHLRGAWLSNTLRLGRHEAHLCSSARCPP